VELRLLVLLNVGLVVGGAGVDIITSWLLQALGVRTVLSYWRNNILFGIKFINSLALEQRALILVRLVLFIWLFHRRRTFLELAVIDVALLKVIDGDVFVFFLFLIDLIIIILMEFIFILSIHNRIFEFWVERFRHDSAVFFFLLFVFFISGLVSLSFFKQDNSLQLIFIELWHTLYE